MKLHSHGQIIYIDNIQQVGVDHAEDGSYFVDKINTYISSCERRIDQQAETISKMEAELEISAKREAELVEKLELLTEWKQQDKSLIKHFKDARDHLLGKLAETERLYNDSLKLVQDSQVYEAMLLDGNDETSAPDYAGVEAEWVLDIRNGVGWAVRERSEHCILPGLHWDNYIEHLNWGGATYPARTLNLAAEDDTTTVNITNADTGEILNTFNVPPITWESVHEINVAADDDTLPVDVGAETE